MKTSAKVLLSAVLTSVTLASLAPAAQARSNKFWVGDADTGRVLYDDGRNDGGCVIKRKFLGFDRFGEPIVVKRVHCF